MLNYISWAVPSHCRPSVMCKVILLASILCPFLDIFFLLSFFSFPFLYCIFPLLSKKWGVYFSCLFAFVLGIVICFGLWSMRRGKRVPFLSLDRKKPGVFPFTLFYSCHFLENSFPWVSLTPQSGLRMNSCESGLPQVTTHQRLQHNVEWLQPKTLKAEPYHEK